MAHPYILHWQKNENRITPPSSSHYKKIDNWMNPVLIFKSKREPHPVLIS